MGGVATRPVMAIIVPSGRNSRRVFTPAFAAALTRRFAWELTKLVGSGDCAPRRRRSEGEMLDLGFVRAEFAKFLVDLVFRIAPLRIGTNAREREGLSTISFFQRAETYWKLSADYRASLILFFMRRSSTAFRSAEVRRFRNGANSLFHTNLRD